MHDDECDDDGYEDVDDNGYEDKSVDQSISQLSFITLYWMECTKIITAGVDAIVI